MHGPTQNYVQPGIVASASVIEKTGEVDLVLWVLLPVGTEFGVYVVLAAWMMHV